MIDLPPGSSVDRIPQVSDWVELACLMEDSNRISQDAVSRVLRASGLSGLQRDEVFENEDRSTYDGTWSDDESSVRATELIWYELARRRERIGEGFPFTTSADEIVLQGSGWTDFPAYTMLLVMDLGKVYFGPRVLVETDTYPSRLFEKIVEACSFGLFGGPASRFGVPIEPGWPTGIDARVTRLGEELGITVEMLDGKTHAHDRDRGLDVAARLELAGNSDGSIVLLTQCATGANWLDKRGEPSLEDWRDLLQWNGKLLRGVAVPWRLEDPWSIKRAYRHFDAMILDRPRIAQGDPDRFLDDECKDEIRGWCEPLLTSLPVLN